MIIVIFSARIRELDEHYHQTAARLRELALGEFGCLNFSALTEGDREVAISHWPSEAHVAAWRDHPEHLRAQALGRGRWYLDYSVEITSLVRQYRHPASAESAYGR